MEDVWPLFREDTLSDMQFWKIYDENGVMDYKELPLQVAGGMVLFQKRQ